MDCNGSGSYDAIVGGLDWIGQNYQLPGVISMSLTTPASPTLDAAVASLVDLVSTSHSRSGSNGVKDADAVVALASFAAARRAIRIQETPSYNTSRSL